MSTTKKRKVSMYSGYHRTKEKNVLIEDIPSDENGKKCDCICISCKRELSAKKGKKNKHHFSHLSVIKDENSTICHNCGETSLHVAGKIILSELSHLDINIGNLLGEFIKHKYSDLIDINRNRYFNKDSQKLIEQKFKRIPPS